MEWTLVTVLFTLIAAGIAVVIRLWDYPSNKLSTTDVSVIGYTLIGALIAAFLTVFLGGGKVLPDDPVGFALVVGAALGGMAGVRAMYEQLNPGPAAPVETVEEKPDL
jgi:hypothetical protein